MEQQQFVEIKLLGELGRKFGRDWPPMLIGSPKQAIRAIAVNAPGFAEYMYSSEDKGIFYKVIIDDEISGIELTQIDLIATRRIIIAPVVTGSGAVGRIIAGAALIATAIAVPGISIFGINSMALGLLGAALVVGGISQLLSSSKKKTQSYTIQSSDTTKEGSCVPVGYGEMIINELKIISSAIVTEEYNP